MTQQHGPTFQGAPTFNPSVPPTGTRGTVRKPSYALVGLVGVGLLALGSVVGAGVNKATTKPEPAVITTVTAEPEPAPTVTATITPEPELHTPATCVLAIEEADEFWVKSSGGV